MNRCVLRRRRNVDCAWIVHGTSPRTQYRLYGRRFLPWVKRPNQQYQRTEGEQRRNVVSDSADVTSHGRSFQVCGPATGKARLPTVDSPLVGTTGRLVPTERSDRRLGRSATRVKRLRYPGASPWTTLYVKTAILNSILSGTHSQWRQASVSEMWLDRHR